VGDQRSLAHPLDLPPARGGEAIFYSLVQLGRPSRLDPVKAVAATLKRHLDEVLRFVEVSITNGVAEELDSQIMRVKPNAGGFRNAPNFTTVIYFHCGGLDLYHAKAGRTRFLLIEWRRATNILPRARHTTRSLSPIGSGERHHEVDYCPRDIRLPGQKQVVARVGPSQHSSSRHTTLERSRLTVRHRLVEAVEIRVRRRTADIVRTREYRQRRHVDLCELPAPGHDRLLAIGLARSWRRSASGRANSRRVIGGSVTGGIGSVGKSFSHSPGTSKAYRYAASKYTRAAISSRCRDATSLIS
jgi:transposase